MFSADSIETGTSLPELAKWVREIADLTQPDEVIWCDGSDDEWDRLTGLLVENGTFTRLNPRLRPNSFWCRSDPSDVARVEDRTFICSEREQDAGPTNNWIAPEEMRETFAEIFDGCMRGRTMYVVPFCMGPLGGEISQLGVEITDSPYVVVSMRIMTRMGTAALRAIEDSGSFVRAVHSVGAPLAPGQADVPWPCNQTQVHLAFPRDPGDLVVRVGVRRERAAGQEVLRAADRLGDGAGRGLAGRAHADPQDHPAVRRSPGTSRRRSRPPAARPTWPCCSPTIPGWKVETIGDDIAWMRFGPDGRLYAINPEAGFFGVAPGTGAEDQRQRGRDLHGQFASSPTWR